MFIPGSIGARILRLIFMGLGDETLQRKEELLGEREAAEKGLVRVFQGSRYLRWC